MGRVVPSFWHPGELFWYPGSTLGPFWHLGSTLEDHGNSGMGTPEQDFHRSFGDFGSFSRVLFGTETRNSNLFRACFQVTFLFDFRSEISKLSVPIQVFAWKLLHKPTFLDFRVDFCRFLEALEIVFSGFCCPEHRFENPQIFYFLGRRSRIPSPLQVGADSLAVVALKLLHNRSTNCNTQNSNCNFSVSLQFSTTSAWWPLASRGRRTFIVSYC